MGLPRRRGSLPRSLVRIARPCWRGVRALAANGLKYAQSGMAQGYVFFMIIGAVAILGYLLG